MCAAARGSAGSRRVMLEDRYLGAMALGKKLAPIDTLQLGRRPLQMKRPLTDSLMATRSVSSRIEAALL